MKNILIRILFYANVIGIDLLKILFFFKGIPFFIRDYRQLKRQMRDNRDFKIGAFYPILNERNSEGGTMRGHYFHIDFLAAKKIYLDNPLRHIDLGSRIDGFVAHVASFRKIEVFDIRPIVSKIDNIIFTQADLMQLPSYLIESCDSFSSLHAIEHFGLGRYGDRIDLNGHLKAISNIHKILKRKGKFYFAVPIGQQRIEFNAHRVFNISYLVFILKRFFRIDSFSYVDDIGDLHENVQLDEKNINSNFNCNYGCAFFELTKY